MDLGKMVDSAEKLALEQVRKYTQPKIIAAVAQMIVCVICVVGIQWVAVGFDLNCWTKPSFWISTSCMTVGVTFLFRAVINARYEKTANRESVRDVRKEYNTRNKDKQLNFKDYIQEYNLNTKICEYVFKIQRKIYSLEKKRLRTIRAKRLQKIDSKIELLRDQMSESYIRENIDRIKVKYFVVYVNDFSQEDVRSNGKLNTRGASKYNSAFNVASLKKAIMYLIPTVAMSAAILAETSISGKEIIVKICGSLFMIIGTIVGALIEGDRIYDATITASLLDKIEILKQYKVWLETNPSKTQLELEREKLRSKFEEEYRHKLLYEVEKIKSEMMSKLAS